MTYVPVRLQLSLLICLCLHVCICVCPALICIHLVQFRCILFIYLCMHITDKHLRSFLLWLPASSYVICKWLCCDMCIMLLVLKCYLLDSKSCFNSSLSVCAVWVFPSYSDFDLALVWNWCVVWLSRSVSQFSHPLCCSTLCSLSFTFWQCQQYISDILTHLCSLAYAYAIVFSLHTFANIIAHLSVFANTYRHFCISMLVVASPRMYLRIFLQYLYTRCVLQLLLPSS